jgi:hypothetical protein
MLTVIVEADQVEADQASLLTCDLRAGRANLQRMRHYLCRRVQLFI